MSSFEIPREEVERMKPEDFIETYSYDYYFGLIQHNKRVDEDGDLRGLMVLWDGVVYKDGGWDYSLRDRVGRKHYRTLEDLVQDCYNEKLLALFMKEHCQ